MSAQPKESRWRCRRDPPPMTARSEIAAGFDSRALERVEDEEELFALESDGAPE